MSKQILINFLKLGLILLSLCLKLKPKKRENSNSNWINQKNSSLWISFLLLLNRNLGLVKNLKLFLNSPISQTSPLSRKKISLINNMIWLKSLLNFCNRFSWSRINQISLPNKRENKINQLNQFNKLQLSSQLNHQLSQFNKSNLLN